MDNNKVCLCKRLLRFELGNRYLCLRNSREDYGFLLGNMILSVKKYVSTNLLKNDVLSQTVPDRCGELAIADFSDDILQMCRAWFTTETGKFVLATMWTGDFYNIDTYTLKSFCVGEDIDFADIAERKIKATGGKDSPFFCYIDGLVQGVCKIGGLGIIIGAILYATRRKGITFGSKTMRNIMDKFIGMSPRMIDCFLSILKNMGLDETYEPKGGYASTKIFPV